MKTLLVRFSLAIVLALALCTSFTTRAQPAPTAASTNYSSLWWNPAESGWGAHITHQGNIIFLALYTYDTDGQPLWLVMSNGGIQADGKTFTGDLFRVTGTPFAVSPFVPITQSNVNVVGTMSVTFTSADVGTMTYSVNGASVVKAIQKQVYGKAAAQCTFTTNTDRSALTNYQDLWWNPNESGWGISLVHQDDILFAALFVYGQTRRDEWYVMSNGPKQADGSFLGDLYRITGPPFNANPFVPLGPDNVASRLTKVGTMSLRFSNGQTGVLTYSVNGVTVVKNIVRQVFGGPVNACSQGIPPQLLLGIGAPSPTGSASMMKIDLTTGAVSSIGVDLNKSIACRAGNIPNFNLVRIACYIGDSHWDYNPITNTTTQNTTLAKLPSSNYLNVLSGPDGTDYYSAGGYATPGAGRVLIRQGSSFVGEIATTSIGNTPTTYVVPKKLVANFASGKLFSMNSTNQNQATPVNLDLIDIATRRVEATVTLDRNGVDMALYNNEVYLATIRTSSGKDLTKYDIVTLAKKGEGTMTGTTGTGAGQHLFAMAVNDAGVHIGTFTGLQTLSHDFTRVLRSTAFPGGDGISSITSSASGKLYIIILNGTAENVLEIDPSTHAVLRKWRIPGSPRDPSVIGN